MFGSHQISFEDSSSPQKITPAYSHSKDIFSTPKKTSMSLFSSPFSKTEKFFMNQTAPHTEKSEEKRTPFADRFIPIREMSSKNLYSLFVNEEIEKQEEEVMNNKENNYKKLLEKELLSIPNLNLKLRTIEEEENNFPPCNKKINKNYIFSNNQKRKKKAMAEFTEKRIPNVLKFSSPAPKQQKYPLESNPLITPFFIEEEIMGKKPNIKEIPSKPIKTLDAPFLEDDFYLNLLDWSSKNYLSVILGNALFLYNHENSQVTRLIAKSVPPYPTSTIFDPTGVNLALGNTDGTLEIYDINRQACLFAQKQHLNRITSLAWTKNPYLLATGSKDHLIRVLDFRLSPMNATVRSFADHKQEVCSLKWSNDGQYLASGGNDNKICIFSLKKDTPELKYEGHTAAVKALAWNNQNRGVLLSGGGTCDTSIKAWNTLSNQIIKETVTGSQVCNLLFSKTTNEFVSSHGFEKNEIVVWNYEDYEKRTILRGHNNRVLFLCMSPDGRYIASGAGNGDETVKIWDIFPEIKDNSNNSILKISHDLR